MFDNVKLIMGIVLIAILGAAGWTYYHRGQEVIDLKVDTKNKQVQIGGLEKTIEQKTASDAITQDTQTKVAETTEVVIQKHEVIAQKVQTKVQEIEQKYKANPAPETSTTQEQKELEISQARIDGLWQAWCETTGSADPTCKLVQTNPQS